MWKKALYFPLVTAFIYSCLAFGEDSAFSTKVDIDEIIDKHYYLLKKATPVLHIPPSQLNLSRGKGI